MTTSFDLEPSIPLMPLLRALTDGVVAGDRAVTLQAFADQSCLLLPCEFCQIRLRTTDAFGKVDFDIHSPVALNAPGEPSIHFELRDRRNDIHGEVRFHWRQGSSDSLSPSAPFSPQVQARAKYFAAVIVESLGVFRTASFLRRLLQSLYDACTPEVVCQAALRAAIEFTRADDACLLVLHPEPDPADHTWYRYTNAGLAEPTPQSLPADHLAREAIFDSSRKCLRDNGPLGSEIAVVWAVGDNKGPVAVFHAISAKANHFEEKDFLGLSSMGEMASTAFLTAMRRQEEERQQNFARLANEELRNLAGLGFLATGLTHEFRQPIRILLNDSCNLDDAVKLKELDVIPEISDRISRNVNRMAAIVRDMEIFVKRNPTPVAKDIGRMLGDIVDVVRPSALEENVTISLKVDKAVGTRFVLPSHLHLAIHNILVNAIDALGGNRKAKNEIHVRAEMESEDLVIVVADNGPGMSANVLAKAQTVQSGFTGESKKGLGIGLELVRRAVQAHQRCDRMGSLDIASTLNQGTTVTIRIPLGAEESP